MNVGPDDKFKLYYFKFTGLAEPIRYLLSYCGIPFENVFVDLQSTWPSKYKKEMPMNQCPVLEVNGVKYHQHLAICRYLARKNQLCGNDEEEACLMDALVDDLNDVRIEVGRWWKVNDDDDLKTKMAEEMNKKLMFTLSKFDSRVGNNNGFFVGKKLSWVDIYYAATTELMSHLIGKDVNDDYANLKKLASRVRNHMMIEPYIKNRPEYTV